MIFEDYCQDGGEAQVDFNTARDELRRKCSDWDAFLLDTPAFWRFFIINPAVSPSSLVEQVVRVKDHAICVSIRYDFDYNVLGQPEWAQRLRAEHISGAIVAIALAAGKSATWRSLSVHVACDQFLTLAIASLYPLSMPMLTSLRFSSPVYDSTYSLLSAVFQQAPTMALGFITRLQYVMLDSFALPWRAMVSCFALSHLDLRHIPPGVAPTALELAAVLHSSPELAILSISDTGLFVPCGPMPPPFELPSLRSLCLLGPSDPGIVDVLALASMPSLVDLDVSHCGADAFGALVRGFEGLARVEDVCVRGVEVDEAVAGAMLAKMKSVEALYVVGVGSAFSDALFKQPTFCQRLRSLTIFAPSVVVLDQFISARPSVRMDQLIYYHSMPYPLNSDDAALFQTLSDNVFFFYSHPISHPP